MSSSVQSEQSSSRRSVRRQWPKFRSQGYKHLAQAAASGRASFSVAPSVQQPGGLGVARHRHGGGAAARVEGQQLDPAALHERAPQQRREVIAQLLAHGRGGGGLGGILGV